MGIEDRRNVQPEAPLVPAIVANMMDYAQALRVVIAARSGKRESVQPNISRPTVNAADNGSTSLK